MVLPSLVLLQDGKFFTLNSKSCSAFDLEREREWRQRENKLKVQIAQLEATLKSDLGEKGSIIDRYANERGQWLFY